MEPVDDVSTADLQAMLRKQQVKYDALHRNQIKLVAQNVAIYSDLECPVCLLYFTGKRVAMCRNGHNVCEPCNGGLNECPVCRDGHGAECRNIFVEMAAGKALRACKYGEEGCQEMFLLDEIEQHEAVCTCKLYCRCFIADDEDDAVAYCQWSGKTSELLAHCIATHPDDIINSGQATLKVPVPENAVRKYIKKSYIFACHEKLFIVAFYYHKNEEAQTMIPIPFATRPDDCEKFRVAFGFHSITERKEVTFSGVTLEPSDKNHAEMFEQNPHFDASMLKMFGNNGNVDCEVRIMPVD